MDTVDPTIYRYSCEECQGENVKLQRRFKSNYSKNKKMYNHFDY